MHRKFSSIAFVALSLALAGCGYTPEQRAASGAALGGATGAAIGAAAGNSAGAALAGGVLGAQTGAIIGVNTRSASPPPPRPTPPRCARFAYDAYGNTFCAAY